MGKVLYLGLDLDLDLDLDQRLGKARNNPLVKFSTLIFQDWDQTIRPQMGTCSQTSAFNVTQYSILVHLIIILFGID